MSYQLHIGDSLDVLKTIPSNSVDSVVTDPPYALNFMGQSWDKFDTPGANTGLKAGATGHAHSHGIQGHNQAAFQNWCEQWAAECLRVLKPGGHLVAFGGTRTYHRLASGIEDAGFEIRDKLDWIYGSGFPKSLDVSKAIDKAAGAERTEVLKHSTQGVGSPGFEAKDRGSIKPAGLRASEFDVTAPATDAAKQWDGWGTALKPAHEPIVLARKPLDARPLVTIQEGIKTNNTVAANVLEHGTGALNIDACRVEGNVPHTIQGQSANAGQLYGADQRDQREFIPNDAGRWPPNILLSHSPYCTNIRQRRIEDPASWDCSEGCPVKEMDRQSGITTSTDAPRHNTAAAHNKTASMGGTSEDWTTKGHADTGGASRFFPIIEWDEESTVAYEFNFRYRAKAAKKERPSVEGVAAHPTVKPLALMRWLAKLVTPPGGTVLEPFGGSGTTAEACELEGFDCVIIEREPDYGKLINARMAKYDTPKEVA